MTQTTKPKRVFERLINGSKWEVIKMKDLRKGDIFRSRIGDKPIMDGYCFRVDSDPYLSNGNMWEMETTPVSDEELKMLLPEKNRSQ